MSRAKRYRAAGVDLDAAERTKGRIARVVEASRGEWARGRVGAFGGMVRVPDGYARPTLVMSTDGVGTKVLVAQRAGRHDTVGQDLVNHSVNDVLVHGATPLAFMDYLAGAALDGETVAAVVEGVARGCRAHDMTLAGGETAEMPDLYRPGDYDLAGTIVGVVEEEQALHGDRVRVGDLVVGYASTGLHTNGYTLARKILFDELRLEIASELPTVGGAVGDVLLEVHRSYAAVLAPVLQLVHALAHVTGGGIAGNLGRSLPDGCGARIERAAWPVPPLFAMLQEAGDVSVEEMYRVFNMGVGMLAVIPGAAEAALREAARSAGIDTWVVGEIVRGHGVALW